VTRPALPTLADRIDDHARRLARCRRCTSSGSTIHPIIPEARAPIAMMVGQAPGQVEAVGGRGFAGRAGRTLFRWLASVGIDETVWRERVLMAAMTRCYPGASPSGRGDRVPSPSEIAACSPWLDAELALVRPRVLVVIGRLAIDRFLGPPSLAEVIGRGWEVAHAGGRSLAIPLPHPSGASSWVHQPGHRPLLDSALALLARELAPLVHESVARGADRVA
jgi:uracil-DNA glycosylase